MAPAVYKHKHFLTLPEPLREVKLRIKLEVYKGVRGKGQGSIVQLGASSNLKLISLYVGAFL